MCKVYSSTLKGLRVMSDEELLEYYASHITNLLSSKKAQEETQRIEKVILERMKGVRK